MPAPKLTDEQIQQGLASISSWNLVGDKIVRKVKCSTFLEAIALINRVAPLAEDADHHPEILNVYDQVEFALTTHDSGGLTAKDFALAKAIDAVI